MDNLNDLLMCFYATLLPSVQLPPRSPKEGCNMHVNCWFTIYYVL